MKIIFAKNSRINNNNATFYKYEIPTQFVFLLVGSVAIDFLAFVVNTITRMTFMIMVKKMAPKVLHRVGGSFA